MDQHLRRLWRARTIAIGDPGDLASYLSDPDDVAWLRRGEGMVGLGVAERAELSRIEDGIAWWTETSSRIEHETELPGGWGIGPVAFGSFAFDPVSSQAGSVMVLPRVMIGRRKGRYWLTTLEPVGGVHPMEMPERAAGPEDPGAVRLTETGVGGAAWSARVAELVNRLASDCDTLGKVVLARALHARAERPILARWLVARLASAYPTCWTFHVDGLVGASPEMLIRSEGGLATSRVLAGTIRRGDAKDAVLAATLQESDKDLEEHEFAVESVADALRPFCTGMNVPDAPSVLQLPNVLHLASDVTGVAHPGVSSLQLAAQLHPSAAVCGTPTKAALAAINELEGLDRGRYAGPVGWIDQHGDGEWAIALRCGQLGPDPRDITLYAGCGIVSRSVPADELAETDAKLRPMLEALGVE